MIIFILETHQGSSGLILLHGCGQTQLTNVWSPTTLSSCLLPPQARKLPPFGLLQAILDKTAFKMAERAQLGQGNSQKFTPFAASAFEGQREKSKA